MAGLTDVLSALDTLDSDEASLAKEQTLAFQDLEAAIKSGGTGPDLQPIVDRLTANHAKMVNDLVAASAADATTTPTTPPTTGS